jgi:hypothetical protein
MHILSRRFSSRLVPFIGGSRRPSYQGQRPYQPQITSQGSSAAWRSSFIASPEPDSSYVIIVGGNEEEEEEV